MAEPAALLIADQPLYVTVTKNDTQATSDAMDTSEDGVEAAPNADHEDDEEHDGEARLVAHGHWGEAFPDTFLKMRNLMTRIGPVRLVQLGTGELSSLLNQCPSFDFKFEPVHREKKRWLCNKPGPEKIGYVHMPYMCITPYFLIRFVNQLVDLKIDDRETSVTFPEDFNDALEDAKAFVERIKKHRQAHTLVVAELRKKQLYIRKIPDGLTIETVQLAFPEAESHVLRTRKSGNNAGKPFDVRLQFATMEEAEDCYEKRKEGLKLDDHDVTLHFSHKEALEREEKKKQNIEQKITEKEERRKAAEAKKNQPPINKLEMNKRKLLLKGAPDDITVEKAAEYFPEAKRHTLRRRKDKPVDVRLEFESEEAAQSYFDTHKDKIVLEGKKANLSFPYKEHLPKEKKEPVQQANQEKRKLPGQQKSGPSFTAKQPRMSFPAYPARMQQQRMQEMQMRQRMVLQQSSRPPHMGMGGGPYGAGPMHRGPRPGWTNNNPPVYGGNAGYAGNSYNSHPSQDMRVDGEDPISMMASLKSTLATIEQKIMSDGDGMNRKGAKRPGNYDGGSNFHQNVGDGSTYNQDTKAGSRFGQNTSGYDFKPNAPGPNYGPNASDYNFNKKFSGSSYGPSSSDFSFSANNGSSSYARTSGGPSSYSQNASGFSSNQDPVVRDYSHGYSQPSGEDNYGFGLLRNSIKSHFNH